MRGGKYTDYAKSVFYLKGENILFTNLKSKFTGKPTAYYAMSIAATWAGIGSLMNGVEMTRTYGVIPSLVWVLGNVFACILFGLVAPRIPNVRRVFCSKPMMWICAVMCVFQAWLSMNGIQSIFSETPLGAGIGQIIAYIEGALFIVLLFKFGMLRNVLTDNIGWAAVYILALAVTVAAMITSRGNYNVISAGLEAENMKAGIWKAFLLLPGPFTYPYFFELLNYNDSNEDGTKKINARKAFILGGVLFGAYMAIVFMLAWANFSPPLSIIKAILITLIGTSTLSSAMYSIYIAFGRWVGLIVNIALVALWHILIPLGVMNMWTLMASVRIYFVAGGIAVALILSAVGKAKSHSQMKGGEN